MQTVLVYLDESGDDGIVNSSSKSFVLTSIYMSATNEFGLVVYPNKKSF